MYDPSQECHINEKLEYKVRISSHNGPKCHAHSTLLIKSKKIRLDKIRSRYSIKETSQWQKTNVTDPPTRLMAHLGQINPKVKKE